MSNINNIPSADRCSALAPLIFLAVLVCLSLGACSGDDQPIPATGDSEQQTVEDSVEERIDRPPINDVTPSETKMGEESADSKSGGFKLSVVDGEDIATAHPMESLSVGDSHIFLLAENSSESGARSTAVVSTVDVAGTPAGAKVGDTYINLAGKKRGIYKIPLRNMDLQPGSYRVSVSVVDGVESSRTFTVTAPNVAAILNRANAPLGRNIALSALGGEIVSVTGDDNRTTWKREFLNDGFTKIYRYRGSTLSEGWQSKKTSTAEIVVAFGGRRIASIDAIGVSPVETTASARTLAMYQRASPIPKDIEIWVSDDLDDASYRKIAEARVLRTTVPQVVHFDTVSARFVKLKVNNTHGSNDVALGELMVFESADASPSVSDGGNINLANPALGGFVVSVSSSAAGNGAWQLTDGKSSSDSGWMSAATDGRSASYTPQDIVLGFGNNDMVLVERIEFEPLAGPSGAFGFGDFSSYQVAELVVSISSAPGAEWQDIGRLEMPADNSSHSIDVNQLATRVRVRVLSNHGGKAIALGEIRVIEGTRPGHRSMVNGAATWTGPDHSISVNSAMPPEPGATLSMPVAKTLQRGQQQQGRLVDVDQIDRYRLSVDAPSTAALTFSLTGKPDVRTSLKLLDEHGAMVKSYMPSADSAAEASMTWLVAPGNYVVEVAETPIYQVIAFDTSGSMSGRIRDLEQAVRSYVASARDDEYINLVRFSDRVEPILDSFSNNKVEVEKALEGQFEAEGSTALIDALYKSAELVKVQQGRQVIVTFTDGQDTSSKASAEALSGLMDKLPLHVYSIGLGSSLTSYNRRTASNGHQYLSSVSQSPTGSRYFAVRESSELASAFDAIGAELRAPAEYTISADYTDAQGELRLTTTGEMIPGLSPPRFELILDASGSMKRASGQQSRMAVAKSVLQSVLQQVPETTEIALRAFGHRVAEGQTGDCEDSELLVPFIAGDNSRLNSAIDKIRALGTTPIAYSVERAIADMADAKELGTIIILVTDGEEECRDDLLQVVQSARDSGLNFSMNIVGFDLDQQTTADLGDVATAAGGGFFAAADAEQLKAAMVKVLSAPFAVLDGSGDVVAQGIINGEPVQLFAGVYTVAIDATGVSMRIPNVVIQANQVRSVRLNRQGDSVGVEK